VCNPVTSSIFDSGVRSLKEKWEWNWKGIHEGYGQSYGNGKGTRNLPIKKNLPASGGKKKLRIASESEKVFARILDELFVCLDLPKISVFSTRTIPKKLTLTPHLVF